MIFLFVCLCAAECVCAPECVYRLYLYFIPPYVLYSQAVLRLILSILRRFVCRFFSFFLVLFCMSLFVLLILSFNHFSLFPSSSRILIRFQYGCMSLNVLCCFFFLSSRLLHMRFMFSKWQHWLVCAQNPMHDYHKFTNFWIYVCWFYNHKYRKISEQTKKNRYTPKSEAIKIWRARTHTHTTNIQQQHTITNNNSK